MQSDKSGQSAKSAENILECKENLMDDIKIKLAVQQIIQILGAPVMNYSPTVANIEREVMIDKAVSALFKLLRDMADPYEAKRTTTFE
jgi:hypothetical protein